MTDLHFGRHDGKSFDDLGAPFLVVHGANESGKSTLAEFLTWAIGGPWRSAKENSGIFHVTGKDHVHGRLAAEVDGTDVDIDAKFKILKNGRPNDLRTGSFGPQAFDAASIAKFFGDLVPMDYQLMYRLYGGSLGDIGSGDAFSDLFTSFAMGSTIGTGNPRASLASLQQRLNSLERPLKELRKAQKQVEGLIKEASKAPDEIIHAEGEIAAITDTIEDLGLQRDELLSELELAKRASEGLVHIQNLTKAQEVISQLGQLDENWEQVADVCDVVEGVVSELDSLSRKEIEAKQKSQSAVTSCGISEDLLRGRTLTPPERQQLESLVRGLVDAKDTEKSLIDAKESLESQLATAVSTASARRTELSLTEDQVTFLDTNDVMSLTERAGRWGEAISTVISKNETLASEKMRVNQLRNVDESGDSKPSRSISRAAIAGGFVLVSLLALWQSTAAIVAGVLLAVVSFVATGQNFRGTTPSSKKSSDNSSVAAIVRSVAEAEETAENHRKYLHDAAGPLVVLLTHPDMARGVITSLGEFSKIRKDVRDLTQAIELQEQRILEAQAKVQSAEAQVAELFVDRGIPMSFANSEFGLWLAMYETAVLDLAAYDIIRNALQQARDTFANLVSPIEAEIRGLDLAVVRSRIREAAKTLEEMRLAEQSLQNAANQVNAAKMDSAEIVSLLEKHSNELALTSRQRSLNEEIETITKSRDDAITARSVLQTELKKKDGVEVLPGLHLEKGEFDNQIDVMEHQQRLLSTATSILSEVIERYESENQDPVVLSASNLVAQVVPNWGEIRFSRADNDDRTPILGRVSSGVRLNDRFISDGGRALMYLAIRTAFAQKDAERRGIALPLICDDPLVHFDDQRSESAIALLAQVSASHQVFLFTCERRTRDIAISHGARVLEI